MKMVQWLSIVLLCILQHAMQPVSAAVDDTLQPKANGIDVVQTAVRKIRNSCIFSNDFGLMQRIALVESNYGRDPDTFRTDAATGRKGIWQMDRIGFNDTKFVDSKTLALVKSKLGVDWENMSFTSANMNVPLYNALAARLLLHRKLKKIPSSIDSQAKHWKKYYNSAQGAGKVSDFIKKVKNMKICSTVGADILFILDASGSIKLDYKFMKQMVVEVAKKFTIGPNATQIAVLTFDHLIRERINFGEHSTLGSLTTAINALNHTRGQTHTHRALNLVENMFQSARALDKGFPRVVIVVTDGQSDDNRATRLAVERLNEYSWLERYAVGMGSEVNDTELQLIAPGCSNVYLIPTVSAITALTDELHEIACQSSVALPPSKPGSGGHSRMNGTLAPNTRRNARDTAVSQRTGRTYALQVTCGSAALYVSLKLENPSSAVYDYKATAEVNKPGVVFVSPSDLTEAADALSQQGSELFSNLSSNASANGIVYMSIVSGASNHHCSGDDSGPVTYQLDAHDGDSRSKYSCSAPERSLKWFLSKLARLSLSISFNLKSTDADAH